MTVRSAVRNQPHHSPIHGPMDLRSGSGLPTLPSGFSFVVDDNGDYVIDDNGDHVIAETL